LLQQRAAIVDNREHLEEVHSVVSLRWIPLQKVGLDEVVTAGKRVAVTFPSSLDLLRAQFHASHPRTEMQRDVRAGIAHPGAELENAVFWSQACVLAGVLEKLQTANAADLPAIA